jgi:flagellar P-ring protein FlgI
VTAAPHRAAALALAALSLLLLAAPPARAERLKDVAAIQGVRTNQIIGYGLVVGLNGTGDKQSTVFTVQSLGSMLAKIGIGVDVNRIQVKNVAAVMVTGELPPFARTGSELDVLVSSLGDARSLEGGTLIATPLFGTDGEIYALAQGTISVGGFSAGGDGGKVQKNHPTVGRVVGGATVERQLDYALASQDGEFRLALAAADFTTALRAANAINAHFGGGAVAHAVDAGTVKLSVPDKFVGREVVFLSEVEQLEIQMDGLAQVVLNERTGTVVMGANVRVGKVAVAHGSLAVTVSVTSQVSQPAPLSRGQTEVVESQAVEAREESASLNLVQGVTVEELVRGLNAIGVTPRDLIVILQAIKAAGALSADLKLI